MTGPKEFMLGDTVEKFAGDYGGPGVVVGSFIDESGKLAYAVAFKIEGGFGKFTHFLRPSQLRAINAEKASPDKS